MQTDTPLLRPADNERLEIHLSHKCRDQAVKWNTKGSEEKQETPILTCMKHFVGGRTPSMRRSTKLPVVTIITSWSTPIGIVDRLRAAAVERKCRIAAAVLGGMRKTSRRSA
eukprot:2353248-Prymnesium_polylepis.4